MNVRQEYLVMRKDNLGGFTEKLASAARLVVPVKKGLKNFVFSDFTSADKVVLRHIPTILPPKKYFMPQRERIQEFDIETGKWAPVEESEKIVIFGAHTCDIAGIQCLNMVFTEEPEDTNYMKRMNNITVIGIECGEYCDEYAGCASAGTYIPDGGYSLMFTELETSFIVHAPGKDGRKIADDTGLFRQASPADMEELELFRRKKETVFRPELGASPDKINDIMGKSFESPVWDNLGKRCVACGNCTNVCPTCYCFDIQDEIGLDLKKGGRIRVWDSCQNDCFAKVAGGGDFRKGRGARQRHRYMRKFRYPVSRFNRCFCTGCGRCTRSCMAGISLKETVNELIEEKK